MIIIEIFLIILKECLFVDIGIWDIQIVII